MDSLRQRLKQFSRGTEANPDSWWQSAFRWTWCQLGNCLAEKWVRYEEAEAAFRQAMTLDPKYAVPWNNLGTLLQDELGRYEEAEQAYLRSLELRGPNEQGYPHGHLVYLYWFHLNRPEDARQHAELGRQVPEDSIGRLLDAAQHLAEDSPGPAFAAFDAALAKEDAKLWSNFLLRVQRTLRYAHAKGYGPQFREWMEAGDYPARSAAGAVTCNTSATCEASSRLKPLPPGPSRW